MIKLGQLGHLKNGLSISKEAFGSGYPFINLNDIFGRTELTEPTIDLVEVDDKILSQFRVENGDILFVRSSVKREGVGQACLISYPAVNTVYSGFIIRFRPNQNFIYPKYASYYLNSPPIRKQILRLASSSANTNINQPSLESISVVFPTITEQVATANRIKSIDHKINLLAKKKEALETYKKGLMQKIFSQELRFKREDGTDYPEWEYKKGDELFSNISDKNHNGDLPILAITQNYGAIPREMIDYDISVEAKSLMSYKIVERGDFIISLRSFQGGIEYSNYRGICSPAYIILRSNRVLESKFFRAYFKTHNLIQHINSKLEGIRDGKMLSYKYFSELNLPYPSIEEQRHIGNLLSIIDEKLIVTDKLLNENTKMKKGLLQQMFV